MSSRLFSSRYVFFYLFLLGLMALLTACGGGGSSSSGGGLPNALNTYSGVETNASITDQTTAQDILLSLAYSSQSNDLGQYVTAVTTDANSSSIGQDKIKNILAEKFKKDAENTAKQFQQQQTITAVGSVVAGNCADILGSPANGSASQNVIEQTNSQIVVDITYNSLCFTDGLLFSVELNGVMRITIKGSNLLNASAQITEMGLYIPNISVKYTDLVTTDVYQDSLTMNMVITFDYDLDGVTIIGGTITIISDIDYQNTVYRFEYYDDGTTTVFKFYHPVHGVIEFTSNVEFDTCSATNGVPVGTASITNTATDTGATFTGNVDCSTYEICLTNSSGVIADPVTDCTVYPWP